MTQRFEEFVVKGDNLTLDTILWRFYRKTTRGLHEKLLAANPGLAAQGVHLPVGYKINLPLEDPNAGIVRRQPIRLYD